MSRAGKPRDVLPHGLPPRGFSRVEAAAYVGISKLTKWVADDRDTPASDFVLRLAMALARQAAREDDAAEHEGED
jgi:hypothetical protein